MRRQTAFALRLVLVLLLLLSAATPSAQATTFTVDSTADAVDANPGDGICATVAATCTLRAAVQEADQMFAEDSITLPAGLYALSLGRLDVSNCISLTITGAGAALTIVDAQNASSIFWVTGPDISLTNFTLRHASTHAIEGGGRVTITGCTIEDNVGAISFGTGLVKIVDSKVAGPVATYGPFHASGSQLSGSFDLNQGEHEITDSTFTDGALGFYYSLKLTRSEVTDTKLLGGRLVLTDSTLMGSSILSSESAVFVTRSTIQGSPSCGISVVGSISVTDSVISGNGCGVRRNSYPYAGSVTITRSAITDNTSAGVQVDGDGIGQPTLTVTESTIARNGGGGIVVDDGNTEAAVVIENSTIMGNSTPGDGGGLIIRGDATSDAKVQLRNVTISGNRATGSGGGIFAAGGVLSLSNVTITDNFADADVDGDETGGGIVVTGGSVSARNSIIANNWRARAIPEDDGIVSNCTGSLTSGGYNLVEDTGGCTLTGDLTGNLLNVTAHLGILQDNGGPTPTHALLLTSPALNAGNPAGCKRDDGALFATDQRGVTRPQFGRCDIGAFEAACGNGAVDLGETCDDGNTADGDCCSSLCRADDDDTTCDDGSACTTGNTCSDGVCGTGTPVTCATCETCAPVSGCVANVRPACHQSTQNFAGELGFSTKGARSVKWQWTKGDALTLADFGDPLGGGAYALCVFDESGATPTVAFHAATRTGTCGTKPCWKQTNSKTFQYKDLQSGGDGLQSLQLRAGPAGKAKILVTGKGPALTLPTLPLATPLRTQLQAANGQCWEARYFEVGVQRNDGKTFKAKPYQP